MFLCATSRLVVATGIANIFVRDTWATNAAAMTLAGPTRTGSSWDWV